MARNSWSEAEKQQIAALVSAGHSRAQIAAEMGKTYASVSTYIHRRLGHKKYSYQPVTAVEKHAIAKLMSNGHSACAIAKELKRPVNTVYTIIRTNQLVRGEPGDAALIKTLAQELPANEVAEKFECSVRQVQLIAHQEVA